MWEFYLCYCEGGFAEHAIGTVQMLLVKPLARPQPIVPPLGTVFGHAAAERAQQRRLNLHDLSH